MLKKLKIMYRLMLSYAIIVILALIIATMALTGLKGARENLVNLVEHPLAADTAIKMCRIETNVAARTIREMLIDTDTSKYPAYKATVEENIAQIQNNILVFKNSYTIDDGLGEKYEAAFNAWAGIGYNIIAEIEKGNDDLAGQMLLTQCSPALQGLVNIAKEIDTSTTALKDKALAKSESDTSIASIVVVAMLMAAVLFSVLIAIAVTKSIVAPVREVEFAAKQLSEGILSTDIKYDGRDEVGDMAESMRDSMKTLSIYIHDIDDALTTMAGGDFNIKTTVPFVGEFKHIETSFMDFSQTISETLGQINASADQVSGGSDQVSQGSQALADGATEQAAAIEELSSSINEITGQINANAKNAQLANKLSGDAGAGVAESNKYMQDMVVAMNEISSTSNAIEKIIKTIDDIAFQTNILALNAAVEAARAGAAGKGFAVVADEVRNLAGKSAEAAKGTTELIQNTISAIGNGTKIANETAQSLQVVVEKASAVTERINEIAKASDEQAQSINQVTIGVEQISAVVQTNSATAEESAAASEELSGQAQILKGLIGNFKLRKDVMNDLQSC